MIRFRIAYLIIILVGTAIIAQLFSLQVIQGEQFRNSSQKRLFRDAEIKAPRGEIFDRNGVVLATNREAFNIEIMKTSVSPQNLNGMILQLVKVLEKNGDQYRDNFPMSINPIRLDLRDNESSESEIRNFYESFKIKSTTISDVELFKSIRHFYKISDGVSTADARKVMAVRYEMGLQPLSAFDPVLIAVDVSKETVAELEEKHLDYPGVVISVEPVREYPNGLTAAHIIGYIGKINEKELKARKDKGYDHNDVLGKSGIENIFEEFIKGKDGMRKVQMDLNGRLTDEFDYSFSGTEENAPKPGNNIYLTIDYKLQKVAEKSLEDTIKLINTGGFKDKFDDAQTGAVVAMDVKSGEILAMASYPAYNPAVFVKGITKKDWDSLMDKELTPLRNRAIQGGYSPGSTFKMVTAIAALEEGRVTVGEKVIDEGIYKRYKDYQPRCWIWNSGHTTHGAVNVTRAIQVSCNYYFYEMGFRTGIDNINKYARMFGLGRKTGVELPGENKGVLAGPEYKKSKGDRWYPGNTLQAAIGQSDYLFTPVQMASYISTLADGGIRNKPHLLGRMVDWKGQPINKKDINSILSQKLGIEIKDEPEALNLDDKYLKNVFLGMESVTGDAGGTAYGTFANFSVKVAGKTGTAQVREYNKNTGKKKSDNAWFVGFAPYDNPKIAVAVIIENGGHGAYTAPVARDIFAEYFGLNKPQTSTDDSPASGSQAENSAQGILDSTGFEEIPQTR
ncbi:MAG: penicillin-binding protein 2 [Deltaproteobacteria bacterium]